MMQPVVDECPELKSLIVELIEQRGPLSFARYMDLCLYHPQYGYYTSERTRIGKQGDFFTSSSVHALFGRLIARQIAQFWQLMGGGAFTVVEQGAGDGYLALDVLETLAEEFPQFYAQLTYRIVEVSETHRRNQQQRLARHCNAGKVDWCRFEHLTPFRGCFISNELVDAFPVHLVTRQDGELREIKVGLEDGHLIETLSELSDARLEDYFVLCDTPLVEGNRTEVNLAAIDWMTQVGKLLEQGAVLTVDYGYPAAELLAPWRRNGTLLCYHRHQSNENPYQHIGCQDITAHVNFTLLETLGRQAGLKTCYFGEQYRFLLGLGFVEELLRLQARETNPQRAQALRMTLKNLILPDGGMGESFKVLIQGKGIDGTELLCARRIRDIGITPDFFNHA
jgi:SAM-dependent MidA family methyltransferase